MKQSEILNLLMKGDHINNYERNQNSTSGNLKTVINALRRKGYSILEKYEEKGGTKILNYYMDEQAIIKDSNNELLKDLERMRILLDNLSFKLEELEDNLQYSDYVCNGMVKNLVNQMDYNLPIYENRIKTINIKLKGLENGKSGNY